MPEIEIATIIPPDPLELFDLSKDIVERSGTDVAWEDRPRVTITANEDDLVQATIGRAMRQFGISTTEEAREWQAEYPELRPAFFGGGVDEPAYFDVLLEEDGSATWLFRVPFVTHRQVAASADAGLFRGDPRRMYLVLDQPLAEGGNGFFFWNEFTRTLPQVLTYIGALYGGLRAFIDLGWAGYKVFLRLEKKWHDKGAALEEIRATVGQPRTTEETACLLGMSETDAETVLKALGLTQSADGRWRTGPDKDVEVLKLAFSIAEDAANYHYLPPSDLERCLDEITALPPEERLQGAHAVIERIYAEEREWGEEEEEETDDEAENLVEDDSQ